ncbi:DNA polymerase III subunit psi [Psychromonas sp. 14N.309.X.WAT.B.A12]|uniref:DNA polymerase III subunit psi n=1 Tax=unclassified Psychromonas TaxID=2614957 RepID=UPI0025AFC453|nr:DNA polymerase III subunit psi [Psychromonas sp. 14N.309.X.WAT.B.A12]MDN2663366.1 DNA polymerase III subunit psi [Psychromonas sp. 14N.309.X.WAT.B.A12]
MKHQQAVFLQEMGITHWQVRKPALFKAEEVHKQLNLSQCELLVVCTKEDKQHPLMQAILNAFEIDKDKVTHCSLAQFENQQGELPTLIWSTIGKLEVAPAHQLLHSPALAILAEQRHAKQTLWKQFCAYRQ